MSEKIHSTSNNDNKTKKKRSRNGCHRCKNLKVKCDEGKPSCSQCLKSGAGCDYSLVLQWGGRQAKKARVYHTMMVGQKTAEDKSVTSEELVQDLQPNSKHEFPRDSASPGLSSGSKQPPPQPTSSHTTLHIVPRNPEIAPSSNPNSEDKLVTPPLLDHDFGTPISTPDSANLMADITSFGASNVFMDFNTRSSTPTSSTANSIPPVSTDQHQPPEEAPVFDLPSIASVQAPVRESQASILSTADDDINILSSGMDKDTDFGDYADDNAISHDYLSEAQPDFFNPFTLSLFKPHHNFMNNSGKLLELSGFDDDAIEVNETATADNAEWNSNPEDNHSNTNDINEQPVTIPRHLEPLPDLLLQVPKYKELFSFFLTCTANFLVPIPTIYKNNPFRELLPRVALSKTHLLSLLIAYGAAHHSKVTKQDLPVAIIKRLLSRTFDGLSRSLEDSNEAKSDATLATAVMLCSYNIVNEVSSSWKAHLQGAKNIVQARGLAHASNGGILTLADSPKSTISDGSVTSSNLYTSGYSPPARTLQFGPHSLKVLSDEQTPNTVSYFLLRTLAYLDVIAGLCSKAGLSILGNKEDASQLWSLPLNMICQSHELCNNDDTSTEFDLLLGMDLSVIPLYTKVVSLLRRRTTLTTKKLQHQGNESEWALEEEHIMSEGLTLSEILWSSSMSAERKRKYYTIKNDMASKNLAAVSLSFSYAVLINLYKRVMLMESTSGPVQGAVSRINDIFEKDIPIGSEMQSCMSFPTVMAACEIDDPSMRDIYRKRLYDISKFGIGHMDAVIDLVEESWKTHRAWAELADERGLSLVLA